MSSKEPVSVPSFWSLKPWWCQPWSILLTGMGVMVASWFLLHWIWLTAIGAVAVCAWWLLFLVLVPRAYSLQALNTEAQSNGLNS
jgi:hypothetical protein